MNRSRITSAIVATFLIFSVVAGPARAEATKKPDVGAGRVTWFDVTTTDLAKSKEFYSKLFNWQFTPVQGTDLAVEIVAGGTPIGTLRVAEGAISPFNGVAYVQVADIQAACKKARDLGGKVVEGFPFNLPDGGAVGLFVDPAGHPMGIYSRTPLPAATPTAK